MSYQTPPPDPYAYQPAPQPPMAQPPVYGYPVELPRAAYASWIKRVAGRLLDGLFELLAAIPMLIGLGVLFGTADYHTESDGTDSIHITHAGGTIGIVLIGAGFIFMIAFGIWNVFVRQGHTGYTLGKSVVGIKLVKQSTGQPIGAWLSFGRQILHTVDGALLYLGWLWPLWDRKRQTFADKIVETVVLNTPKR
ncbi:RDD family protein [Nocardioides sp. Iso805N]|uniref:RDD family protein n=1 Tax=Nocardioides sp. Iso805N TaxID=1283287 RepID=UPI00036891D4|nr:RDD family protein [Nocardioides sp. Iso805N]